MWVYILGNVAVDYNDGYNSSISMVRIFLQLNFNLAVFSMKKRLWCCIFLVLLHQKRKSRNTSEFLQVYKIVLLLH